jgi:hypothetical protein
MRRDATYTKARDPEIGHVRLAPWGRGSVGEVVAEASQRGMEV